MAIFQELFGECVMVVGKNCPERTFYDRTLGLFGRCRECPRGCAVCEEVASCRRCMGERVLDGAGQCVCQQGYQEKPDGTCTKTS